MTYDTNRPARKLPRKKDYDYAQPGAYFLTLCVQRRLCLFGEITQGEMYLNHAGRMIAHWWHELNRKYVFVQTDAMVVMPNHFHGILFMHVQPQPMPVSVGSDTQVTPGTPDIPGITPDTPTIPIKPIALPTVMQWFKTMTTNAYIRGVKDQNWEPFLSHLWQESYHDHILRDEADLNAHRQYIAANPSKWHTDTEYPVLP